MGFKRITAAFDDVARARLCQSSGSEHSAVESNSVTDLSDLVDSFLQTDGNDDVRYKEKEGPEDRDSVESEGYNCMELESKEILMSLISDQDTVSQAKQMIHKEMEKAYRILGNSLSEGFKRRAMSWLRQRGFDAGEN